MLPLNMFMTPWLKRATRHGKARANCWLSAASKCECLQSSPCREPFIALEFFGDLFSEGLTAPGPLDLIATSYAYDLVASALSKLPQPVSQEQGEETADAFYQILLQRCQLGAPVILSLHCSSSGTWRT